ncbi:methionyl-tRNA formyltransferase [Pseudothermotoga hypogea DSM 11164 = NBRC 106472]|uniref:Methionyl-tRNA formyltransferase n=2 Tax=Pseudothermotoga hypogea TaxID=57487 RepID=A0A0X1KS08_9THEM|nr:methionyl-tRNA formyltransferase [Pseudothermotoga hypogea]AJC74087.1 methionyl-tRNA formyltransferase [Pseudothermotoga hypogea DSM 11164 = NBRC 106472]MBC7123112.1 methionyl-tRNA formyltransferase [Pseudothermotoga sp.]
MRILFLGTPHFAAKHLETLLKEGLDVVAVVTQADKPFGRGLRLTPSPVKVLAQQAKIPVYEQLKQVPFDVLNIDICIVVAYGKIIPRKYLDMLPFYNVHPSLLPKYRGAAPIQRAIENGEESTGVTIFKLTDQLDAGPIVMQESVEIEEFETFDEVEAKLLNLGCQMLVEFLKNPFSHDLVPQDESQASYAPKIEEKDLLVDFAQPAERVKDKIRAYDSRPGARTFLNGQCVKLFGVRAIEPCSTNVPGTVIRINRDGAFVATSTGLVLISHVQFPGKRKMTFFEAYNGRLIKINDRFHV